MNGDVKLVPRETFQGWNSSNLFHEDDSTMSPLESSMYEARIAGPGNGP